MDGNPSDGTERTIQHRQSMGEDKRKEYDNEIKETSCILPESILYVYIYILYTYVYSIIHTFVRIHV